ncbi:hypothetical protein [Undibacterium parvum]|uniref:Uncharacterized protein n=1 Tax=Undibacterium parvum TaxID=401471 RepID=A0A3Q9BQX0_9BURK|nr:hypothetical protein [Undibacterium parvum]AZP12440.1 hypothetical protein EJN92_10750 [Undibacterium parvum]
MQRSTKILIVSSAVIVAALLVWQWTEADNAPENVRQISPVQAPASSIADSKARDLPLQQQEPAAVQRVALLPTGSEMSATQSLLDTRNGDPRSPPVIHNTAEPTLPSADELADPKAYQQYEARQNMRLYSSFIDAAQTEVPRLKADVARAREVGIAAADISKVEEKIKRIEAMQAQLLRDHPQLLATSPEKK